MPYKIEKIKNEKNIFEEVQERYSIIDVAADLGINLRRVGRTYRAWSIANDGTGENAFTAYHHSNTWYDFALKIGGDITDLVAYVKFNGDKKAALMELLPDFKSRIDHFWADKQKFYKEAENFRHFLTSKKEDSITGTRHIFDYLHQRGLSDEYIERIGLGCDRENRLFIPYWGINGKEIVYFITRRLPSIYGTENENAPKYKKASAKDFPFLHNQPWGLHTLNRDRDELIITEGAVDAMLLDQAEASVLTPNGGDFGNNWDDVLNHCKEFKYVILAFDNDERGKEFTFNAAKKLIQQHIPFKCAVFTGKDIAEFFQIGGNLDTIINSARNGCNWLANRFTEGKRFEELSVKAKENLKSEFKDFLFEVASVSDRSDVQSIIDEVKHFFPSEWLKDVKKDALKGPDEMVLAERVIERFNIKYDDRTGAYRYFDYGCWGHITANELNNLIIQVIGRKCTASKLMAVARIIKGISQAKELITKLDKMPVFSLKNGTLHIDYENGKIELKPHSPYDYTTMQANYYFIPDAKSSIFIPALKQIFNNNEDSITTLQEYFGYVLLNNCRFHKALVALGCGGNGKSLITDVLRALLGGLNEEGKGLVSATMLSKFGKDFRTMTLKNSWVNISSETDIRVDGAEANFKIITSGEPIEDSYKGKDPVTFLSRTKLIINCNEFPIFNDTSKGLSRRLLFLQFPINFVDEPREGTNERKLNPNLVDEIINNQEEMAGILNWALQGLGRILKNNGFTITESQKKLMKKFERFNNPVLNFMEDNEDFLFNEDGEGEDIQRTVLYAKFKEWLIEQGEKLTSARAFYHTLENTLQAMSSGLETHQVHGLGIFIKLGKRPLDFGINAA